jgi:hypothetical protein
MKQDASSAFLKKSPSAGAAQKTFANLDRARFNACGPVKQKFSASFFQKRSACLLPFCACGA